MVCGKCGKAFDESAQATEGRCPFCKTVHTPEGDPIRELKGILSYIARNARENVQNDPHTAAPTFSPESFEMSVIYDTAVFQADSSFQWFPQALTNAPRR